jgi:hypothetical protein
MRLIRALMAGGGSRSGYSQPRLNAPLPAGQNGPVQEDVQSPRLSALWRYWNSKRRAGQMPALTDIDPLEIPSLLPIVLLADIVDRQPRIRLLGSEATTAYGSETRGLPVCDLGFGEFTGSWREAWSKLLAGLDPVAARGFAGGDGQRSEVEMLLMPLAGADGAFRHALGGLVIKPVCPRTASRPGDRPAARVSDPRAMEIGIGKAKVAALGRMRGESTDRDGADT